MKLSPSERANQVKGSDRLGVYLSYMRKRPEMFFGEPPYLEPFFNFILGYDLAEMCHDVEKRHLPSGNFTEWLIQQKGLKDLNLGWPRMIQEDEPDDLRQLEKAIDWFAEHSEITLLDESEV